MRTTFAVREYATPTKRCRLSVCLSVCLSDAQFVLSSQLHSAARLSDHSIEIRTVGNELALFLIVRI